MHMADRGQQQLVRIAPYNCAWADICSIEVEAIRGAVAPARVFIDHVGSTAVQGLDGKPVIDLLITLMDWSEAEKIARSLAALGYQQESVNRNPPRRFLHRTVNIPSVEGIHLHLVPRDSEWGCNMLVFRDELIADGELAIRYAALKRQLAAEHANDPDAYTAAKTDFVRRILRTAAGAFSNDRLLTHQRAELSRAQRYQNLSVLAQLCVAIVAAISVFSDDNGTQLNFAILGFGVAAVWFTFARKQRSHRTAGDQARRVVLLASGLDEHFSAEQRLRIFDKFTVSVGSRSLVREEAYFASRASPGYRRLAELIEESAYWTRDLQETSAIALKWMLLAIGLLMGGALWTGILTSADTRISIARVLVAMLVFLLSSDVVGAMLAHSEAAGNIGEILQRAEAAAARGYPSADVLLLMSDYNAAVESAPFALPGSFQLRRASLTRRWRAYLENKRR